MVTGIVFKNVDGMPIGAFTTPLEIEEVRDAKISASGTLEITVWLRSNEVDED